MIFSLVHFFLSIGLTTFVSKISVPKMSHFFILTTAWNSSRLLLQYWELSFFLFPMLLIFLPIPEFHSSIMALHTSKGSHFSILYRMVVQIQFSKVCTAHTLKFITFHLGSKLETLDISFSNDSFHGIARIIYNCTLVHTCHFSKTKLEEMCI